MAGSDIFAQGASAVAGATPWGAAANAISAAAGGPNSSGDAKSGAKYFSIGSPGAINFGTGLPSWTIIAAVAVAAVYFLRRKK